MKKLLLIIFALTASFASAQNYNFNYGGLQHGSGPSVPASCSRAGSYFFKNAATKGWYICNGATYDAVAVGASGVSSVSGTTNQINVATGTTTPVLSLSNTLVIPGTITSATYATSAANGGITGSEGTGAALAAASGVDLLYPDSVSHCWHANQNAVDVGCVATYAVAAIPTFPSITSSLVGSVSVQQPAADTVSCPNGTSTNFATTYTIPANYLTAAKTFRVHLGFIMTTSAGPPNFAVRLRLGTTDVYLATSGSPGNNQAGVPTGIEFLISGTAAAGASVAVYTSPIVGHVSTNSVFSPFEKSTVNQPVSLATNGTLAITPGLFCSANTAGNSMQLTQMIVEALN